MPEFRVPTPEQIAEWSARKPRITPVQGPESVFRPFDVSGLNRDDWENLIIYQASRLVQLSLDNSGKLPSIKMPRSIKSPANDILHNFYDLEYRLSQQTGGRAISEEDDLPEPYLQRKLRYFRDIAKEMKKRKDVYSVAALKHIVDHIADGELPDTAQIVMTHGVYTLYLMVCDPTRFFVGAREGGTYWKNMILPRHEDQLHPPLTHLAMDNVARLPLIGQKELTVVPEKPIHPDYLKNVLVPKPARSLENLLEDAYYHRRYNVPSEGAEVRFRRAGDLMGMVLVESGNMIMSKIITTYGEAFVAIDLNNATYISPAARHRLTITGGDLSWATITAETYRDLITADEVSVTRFKSLRTHSQSQADPTLLIQGSSEDPQIIYIPRTVRVRHYEDPRPQFSGDPRPTRPHRVSGHRRKGNMTPEHREMLLKLERQWGGIKFVDKIPFGHTWVKPHVSPKGSEESIRDLPIFIKKRIETQIVEGLKL